MAIKFRMKRLPRPDDAFAFVDDVGLSHERVADDDAESFGEEFVATITTGDNAFEKARDELVDDELAPLELVDAFETVEAS